MAKPLVKPRWASTVTADPTRYFEPPAGKKDIGWDVGERPPAQYENWLRGTTNDWIDWLDAYESTAHTWTATQTFNPSTAAPGIVLGYNSSTATANETPALAFAAGANTMSAVDRLGLVSKRHITREYAWWGAPYLPFVGPADTDDLLIGEWMFRQRHSGAGPAMIGNNFLVASAPPEEGAVGGPTFDGYRYLFFGSNFASVAGQYHVLYGDSVIRLDSNLRAIVMDFTIRARVPDAPGEAIVALGLFERGVATLPGVGGRDPVVANNAFLLATANIYGRRWQVFKRIAGVTTATDTGVLSTDANRRVRIEIVKDPALGGPITLVYIDGALVHSSTSFYTGDPHFAFGARHRPTSVGGLPDNTCQLLISPVRITALYNNV